LSKKARPILGWSERAGSPRRHAGIDSCGQRCNGSASPVKLAEVPVRALYRVAASLTEAGPIIVAPFSERV